MWAGSTFQLLSCVTQYIRWMDLHCLTDVSSLWAATQNDASTELASISYKAPFAVAVVYSVLCRYTFSCRMDGKKEKKPSLSSLGLLSSIFHTVVRSLRQQRREKKIYTLEMFFWLKEAKKRRVREWREEGQKKEEKNVLCSGNAPPFRSSSHRSWAEQLTSKTKGPKNNIREYISESNETMNEQREKRTDPMKTGCVEEISKKYLYDIFPVFFFRSSKKTRFSEKFFS